MFDLYQPGDSRIHRVAPAAKILALAVSGTLIFTVGTPPVVLAFLAGTLALYRLARMTLSCALRQIRPVAWILAVLFIVQLVMNDAASAVLVAARFAVLLMLAGLLTLTTRSTEMIDAMERVLGVLRVAGINPAKVSLALSLALRFIPVLARITQNVREAQKVRGLERSVIAVAIPVAVRTLRMADAVSDAMEARSYDPHS
jgi:biotin transport system permease protein